MKRKAWLVTALGLAAVALAVLVVPTRERAVAPPPPVRSAAPAYVAAEGKVEALPGYDVNVSSGELNGKVERILVRQGDAVRAGQVVAVLQNEELRAAVRRAGRDLRVAQAKLAELRAGARSEEIAEARAALAGAQAQREEAAQQLERYRELHEQGVVSSATLDERRRAFDAARAGAEQAEQRLRLLEAGPRPETVRVYADQVALARAALDYNRSLLDKTYVRSPIAGTVIERYLDAGEGVTPEIPILDVADLERVWINVEVDETDIGKLRVGDGVAVTSDAFPGRIFKGRVRQIADYAGLRRIRPANPAVNLGLKVVQVKVDLLERTPLRLGMTVDARITPGAAH